MERRGLLRRRPHPEDGRGTVVQLTEAGRHAALLAQPVIHGTVHHFVVDTMDADQLRSFGARCHAIRERIDATEPAVP